MAQCHNVRGEDGPCDCAGCQEVAALRQRVEGLERERDGSVGWRTAKEQQKRAETAEKRVEDYDAIRKERDYYAIEFSALTSDVPPGAKKTLLDTIRSLRQRVEELEREVTLKRAAAETHYAYGEAQKELAEAAEAKLDDVTAKLSNVNRLVLDREAKLARCVEALALMYDEWMDQGHNDPSAPLLCMHSELAERMARAALAAAKGGE